MKNFFNRFKQSLVQGQKYEQYIKKLMVDYGWDFLYFNDNYKFDIMMTNKKDELVTIEVKSDDKSYYTNNLYIEYESWNKPSGVMATTANFFIYVLPKHNQIWFMRTSDLKHAIIDYNPEINNTNLCWMKVKGGDGKKTKGYLWNMNNLKEVLGNKLKIINKNNII